MPRPNATFMEAMYAMIPQIALLLRSNGGKLYSEAPCSSKREITELCNANEQAVTLSRSILANTQ